MLELRSCYSHYALMCVILFQLVELIRLPQFLAHQCVNFVQRMPLHSLTQQNVHVIQVLLEEATLQSYLKRHCKVIYFRSCYYGFISCTGYLHEDVTGLCTACPIGSVYAFGTTNRNATCALCAAGSISNYAGSLVCTRMTILCSHFDSCFDDAYNQLLVIFIRNRISIQGLHFNEYFL